MYFLFPPGFSPRRPSGESEGVGAGGGEEEEEKEEEEQREGEEVSGDTWAQWNSQVESGEEECERWRIMAG